MTVVPIPETLRNLHHRMARIDARSVGSKDVAALRFDIAAIDDTLGGGLAGAALHELAPVIPVHAGTTVGFALALAVRARRSVLWIQNAPVQLEAGALYGTGLNCFGLPMDRLVMLEVARAADSLWAMEEALRCASLTVIAEFYDDAAAVDLTAMRRLSLAARSGNSIGLLLRHRTKAAPSPAVTRWEVAPIIGVRDKFGGLGLTTFALSLTKNRHGPCGRWVLSWDHHARAFHFPALPFGVAETARDRPDCASFRQAG